MTSTAIDPNNNSTEESRAESYSNLTADCDSPKEDIGSVSSIKSNGKPVKMNYYLHFIFLVFISKIRISTAAETSLKENSSFTAVKICDSNNTCCLTDTLTLKPKNVHFPQTYSGLTLGNCSQVK